MHPQQAQAPMPQQYRPREPLLAIVILIVVLGGVVTGIILVLKLGYHGYENTSAGKDLIRLNDQAVAFLNRGDYIDAYPRLNYVIEHTPVDTPLHTTVMHNMGTYYFEAGQDARSRGDLAHARDDYLRAYPLLPEKQSEIRDSLQTIPAAAAAPAPAAAHAPALAAPAAAASTSSIMPVPAGQPASPAPPAPSGLSATSATSGRRTAPAGGDEKSIYDTAFRAYQDGLHAEADGHTAAAIQDYNEAVSKASYLSYVPPWVTDARARSHALQPTGSGSPKILGLPAIGSGL